MSRSHGLAYTSRHGTVYYLCATSTKTGKTRYVMARQPVGQPLDAVPAGHEIVENINGTVSVRQRVPPLLTEAECQAVQGALAPDLVRAGYRAEIVRDAVVVFEPQGGSLVDLDLLAKEFGLPTSVMIERYARRVHRYQPLLRFRLLDAKTRRFAAERMCFRGGYEGWIDIINADAEGDIGSLAEEFCFHLGQESFYELY